MKQGSTKAWRKLSSEYGMLIVLLLMMVTLSVLTLEEQNPRGVDGGRLVAQQVSGQLPARSSVIIVTEDTPLDRAFSEAAATDLKNSGLNVVAVSNGSPRDARRTIESVLSEGQDISAIVTTADTAAWGVYAAVDQLTGVPVLAPEPYWWPTFARPVNLLQVANQTAVYAIIAIGMTMVIVTAGIDLSVGSLVALASVVTGLYLDRHGTSAVVLPACLLGIAVCAAAGVFNGVVITQFGIPPFIATLAMMMMARGLARSLTDEKTIDELPAAFGSISDNTAGIPNPVLLMIVLYIIAHLVMSRTVFGRYVYAVGGNPEAARLSGVRVKTVTLVVYTLCGALAGLGGIVQSAKLGVGDPKLAAMMELDVIAAVVVGGTSLMGGEGRIFGTLIGAFIIAVMRNGMNLTNVGSPEQSMVLGAVVLAAVLIDTWKRRRSH